MFKPTLKTAEPFYDFFQVLNYLHYVYPTEISKEKVIDHLMMVYDGYIRDRYIWVDTRVEMGIDEYYDTFLKKLVAEFYDTTYKFRII